jgi:hypothetical protein
MLLRVSRFRKCWRSLYYFIFEDILHCLINLFVHLVSSQIQFEKTLSNGPDIIANYLRNHTRKSKEIEVRKTQTLLNDDLRFQSVKECFWLLSRLTVHSVSRAFHKDRGKSRRQINGNEKSEKLRPEAAFECVVRTSMMLATFQCCWSEKSQLLASHNPS